MPSAEAAKIHFTLTAVVVDGATVFTNADFVPLYQSLVGKNVALAQIFELRDAITAKYRRAGFVLSQAIVPPQKITGGVVHIRVIEGYLRPPRSATTASTSIPMRTAVNGARRLQTGLSFAKKIVAPP